MTSPDAQGTSRNASNIHTWPQWFSVMLRAGGAIGATLSLLAVLALPLVTPTLIRKLEDAASSTAEQIEELAQTLDLSAKALKQTASTMRDASGVFSTTNVFIEDSVGLLQTLGVLLGEKAPDTIESTQDALGAAREGAKAIDSTLRALSVIEFLTKVSYDPENSLSASLQEVALSLNPLPGALRDVHEEMNSSALSLDDLRPQFSRIVDDLDAFSRNASTVAQELEKRGNALEGLAGQFEDFSTKISTRIWVLTAFLMSIFSGLAIAQLSVYVVGTNLSEKNERLP